MLLPIVAEKKEKEDAFLRAAATQLSNELKEVFVLARQQQLRKPELLLALQQTLQPYEALLHSPYQVAVNNLITQYAATEIALSLGQSELAALWQLHRPPGNAGEEV